MVETQMLKLVLDTNVFLMFFRFFFYFFKTCQKDHFSNKNMAERMGFEPMIEFPLYTLSKRAPSTTRPPLQNTYSLFILKTPMNASWGISTFPNCLALALPFFCFSRSFLFLSVAPPP